MAAANDKNGHLLIWCYQNSENEIEELNTLNIDMKLFYLIFANCNYDIDQLWFSVTKAIGWRKIFCLKSKKFLFNYDGVLCLQQVLMFLLPGK